MKPDPTLTGAERQQAANQEPLTVSVDPSAPHRNTYDLQSRMETEKEGRALPWRSPIPSPSSRNTSTLIEQPRFHVVGFHLPSTEANTQASPPPQSTLLHPPSSALGVSSSSSLSNEFKSSSSSYSIDSGFQSIGISPPVSSNSIHANGLFGNNPSRRLRSSTSAETANESHRHSKSLPQTPAVTSLSFSGLSPSPAVSFLSSIAEATAPLGRQPQIHGWKGEQIGGYLVGRQLGTGQFAVVHEASAIDDSKIPSVVAVKIIHCSATLPVAPPKTGAGNRQRSCSTLPRVAERHTTSGQDEDAQRLAAIRKEIQIWQDLNHPHIVRLLEVHETESQHVLMLMEYCSHGSLLTYIQQSQQGLSEAIAAYLFGQCVEAVAYLHLQKHIVHRDLKPENVLLTTDAGGHLVAKLTDFGLATRLSVSAPSVLADVGYACGSLPYCSPEELAPAADRSQLSFAVDQWALGVMLYAMVTGKLPFDDDYMPRLQMKILSGRFIPLPTLMDGLHHQFSSNANKGKVYDPALRELVDALLTADPKERWTIQQVQGCLWLQLYKAQRELAV